MVLASVAARGVDPATGAATGGGPQFGTEKGPVEVGTLSSASGQGFGYSGTDRRLTAQAPPATTDGNLREVFWADNAPWSFDQETCATWNDTATSGGSVADNRQMGLALRISPATSDGRRGLRAITLTQNVYAGATWVFWVDVWKVVDPTEPKFHGVKQFDLRPVVGFAQATPPPPWHVCARVRGRTFTFKIWTGTNPEPTWHDTTHVFTTHLPAGWNYPGYAGGYIGHLRPGASASFSGLSTRSLPPVASRMPGSSRTPSVAPSATPLLGWPAYIG